MATINPWVPVDPSTNNDANIGQFVTMPGVAISLDIPTSVVPASAKGGILVNAWYMTTGTVSGVGSWRISVNVSGDTTNWFFFVFLNGVANSYQTFWLPMPDDRTITVTFSGQISVSSDLLSTITGGIQIQGYYPS